MISMDFATTYRCPDCDNSVWVPLTTTTSDRGTTVRIVVREEEFQESFERHVMLEPDRHPSFVIRHEDDVHGDEAVPASNG